MPSFNTDNYLLTLGSLPVLPQKKVLKQFFKPTDCDFKL